MKWTVWGIIFYVHAFMLLLLSVVNAPVDMGMSLEEVSYYSSIENGYVILSVGYLISGTLLIGVGGIIKQIKNFADAGGKNKASS